MFDPTVANSSGYFKDPVTKQDLSVGTPRVIPAALENGKFTWPMVLSSDGENLLKIVYKYFTDAEKDLYKQYRGRPLSGESKPRQIIKREVIQKDEEPAQVVVTTHADPDTEDTVAILTLLAGCDTQYGVSFINGEMYCLVGKRSTGKYHHIRRDLIPDAEWERIYSAYYPEG